MSIRGEGWGEGAAPQALCTGRACLLPTTLDCAPKSRRPAAGPCSLRLGGKRCWSWQGGQAPNTPSVQLYHSPGLLNQSRENRMVAQAYVEAGGSGSGHLWLHGEFETSQGYMRPCLQMRKNPTPLPKAKSRRSPLGSTLVWEGLERRCTGPCLLITAGQGTSEQLEHLPRATQHCGGAQVSLKPS